jgi:hypothetical protein
MTNVLFLTFYYALLFPAGFFFAAATLAIHYLVDKYCLLRKWAPAPMLGSAIADMSRIYFFSSAIAVYAVVSSYNFASWPYDNACGMFVCVLSFGWFVDTELFLYLFQRMIQGCPPNMWVALTLSVVAASLSQWTFCKAM